MSDPEAVGSAEELAKALGASEAWLGIVLDRFGVMVSDGGQFSLKEFRDALSQASRNRHPAESQIGSQIQSEAQRLDPSVLEALQTISEMGTSEARCREWLSSHFLKSGLRTVDSKRRRGAHQFVLERDDGKKMWVMTYVALRIKEQTGQIGFSLSATDDESGVRPWVAFIAQPWGRVFLKRRSELLKSKRSGRATQKTVFVTFSAGIHEFDFDRRIEEMIADDEAWNLLADAQEFRNEIAEPWLELPPL